jgi:S1-C subfamily serine protease
MKLRVNLFKIFVIALLIGNIAVLGIVGYNKSAESTALFMLENKIEILSQYYKSITQKVIDEYNEILIASSNKILDLEKLIDNLQVELDKRKSIDLTEVNRIKEANLYIINATEGYSGSGTHVKIKGESYILTCAHLLKGDNDIIVAQDDSEYYHITEIVKVNPAMDLMLLKTKTIEEVAYLEISDIFPEQGSEVTVIGNDYRWNNCTNR